MSDSRSDLQQELEEFLDSVEGLSNFTPHPIKPHRYVILYNVPEQIGGSAVEKMRRDNAVVAAIFNDIANIVRAVYNVHRLGEYVPGARRPTQATFRNKEEAYMIMHSPIKRVGEVSICPDFKVKHRKSF